MKGTESIQKKRQRSPLSSHFQPYVSVIMKMGSQQRSEERSESETVMSHRVTE
ncbi:hypothetical protein [Paenibacillus xylanexedens]|uniref:hypothetical protein n=1 Tax=Paenibacillus xylanexedens TaxID=528191 RepID=UPI001642D013|nr:hypothetical protein [Paenibacillus xylanexedens]